MKLRNFRNYYFGHIPVTTLTTCEFEKLWTILEATLHRLSTALDDIFKEKINQKIVQLKTCASTENMKLQLELMKHIQDSVRECHDDVREHRNDTQTLHEDFKVWNESIKEWRDQFEKSIIRVEKCISKPSDSLSRTEMQDGMGCILESIKRLEARMTCIESSQKINRKKLEDRIDLMRAKIELHVKEHSDVHVRTRALDHAINILLNENHIVLKGKPGEGKTYLALSLVADLVEMKKEISPVEISNTQEWDEMVDTKLHLVVLLDDALGKYGVSETDLDG
ncbi:hypothetical protein CHS0354_040340 [Potamilus streckersoni]|uniref:Novel STAND NTPase 3 domain-containing protein n=1 Tax=Potamilus streckersoni TaxID=2493646 RepID=A0AAE0VM66_9BIVA|nr:hypothetical protein CHS0354_040340 [Potamilus streckersoni]